ncbi:hydroxyethylthiazole kinase [Carnobacteriaceae bacterium zg-ZUI252]|nr:hydroxyethylthiazole kinase [Carnobacteriaceae bacterium zg-ZUI252]MBS4770114.1 hydroxyethylthiazole kinase [Carnobacteriaceae bacterium zg-ZUI240]
MIQTKLPLPTFPLVHCITNGITNEYVANALHAFGAKPIIVEDRRSIEQTVRMSDALFLNFGHLTNEKEAVIRDAMAVACTYQKPVVIDIVGIALNAGRYQLAMDLLELGPSVVKGNVSEMRHLCGLATQARGIDSAKDDHEIEAVNELLQAMRQLAKRYPQTTFLATGYIDIVANATECMLLKNGVPYLDRFSGSGDVVGALISAVLPFHQCAFDAVCDAVSYFNIAGEKASAIEGIGTFRIDLLNKLEKVQETEWVEAIEMEKR